MNRVFVGGKKVQELRLEDHYITKSQKFDLKEFSDKAPEPKKGVYAAIESTLSSFFAPTKLSSVKELQQLP
jgi:hypothetical protein